MITKDHRELLEKQQYRIVGMHSAVKVCGWTKSMINGNGACYKHTFYGIMSNQCMQMSTSLSCANRCVFCWRGYKAPVSKEWKWGVDDPDFIVKKSIENHHKLLLGFKGSRKANKKAYEMSRTVRHVALSLTGEPIIYPRINEAIEEFHKRKISTFLVTNAQYPEAIASLSPITQLYLSVDAPDPETLKRVDAPMFDDYWERMIKSLKEMRKKEHRTTVRLTIIKGMNDFNPEGYARLIKEGNPDFIEVKSYMHLGESRLRLGKNNVPSLKNISEFSSDILEHLDEYAAVSAHKRSKVVMLAKKKFFENGRWMCWIDFERFFELEEKKTEHYMREMPRGFANAFEKDLKDPKFWDSVKL